jgi:hypothetical protein
MMHSFKKLATLATLLSTSSGFALLGVNVKPSSSQVRKHDMHLVIASN